MRLVTFSTAHGTHLGALVGSSIYHVFEGKGATIIDGIRFEWEQGDMFVIPSWACHEHLNASGDEQAILFSMHDTLRKLSPGTSRQRKER